MRQVDISVDSLPVFLQKISKISKDNSIEFYISVSLEKDKIPEIDSPDYKVLS